MEYKRATALSRKDRDKDEITKDVSAFANSAGGILIYDTARNVLGAIGISGDTSDRDEECAVSGVKAAGLQT